jgi:hypothetical protein
MAAAQRGAMRAGSALVAAATASGSVFSTSKKKDEIIDKGVIFEAETTIEEALPFLKDSPTSPETSSSSITSRNSSEWALGTFVKIGSLLAEEAGTEVMQSAWSQAKRVFRSDQVQTAIMNGIESDDKSDISVVDMAEVEAENQRLQAQNLELTREIEKLRSEVKGKQSHESLGSDQGDEGAHKEEEDEYDDGKEERRLMVQFFIGALVFIVTLIVFKRPIKVPFFP